MGSNLRITKKPPKIVTEWENFLSLQLKARKLQGWINRTYIVKTAARLALVGPNELPLAREAHDAFCDFFFSDVEKRIMYWQLNIELIPPDRNKIILFVKAVQAAGTLESVFRAKFHPPTFIEIALALPDPKAYVEVCRREGHVKISSAFCAPTYKFMSSRYRGVCGVLANPEYSQYVSSNIPTIQ